MADNARAGEAGGQPAAGGPRAKLLLWAGVLGRGGRAALPRMLVGDVGKLEKGKNNKDGPDSLFCLLFSLVTCPLNLDSH